MTDLLNGIPRVDPTADPPWTLRVVARILSTGVGSAVHRRVMAPLDVPLMRMTGGRVHFGKGTIPIVVLRSTGAKSGIARDSALAAGYASNFASYAVKTDGIRAINVFRLQPASRV